MHPTCPRTQVYSIYTTCNPNFKQIENVGGGGGGGCSAKGRNMVGLLFFEKKEFLVGFQGVQRGYLWEGKVKEWLFVSLRLDQLGVAHVPKGTANLVD